MTSLSIGAAWTATAELIRREGALLLPVALTLSGFPSLMLRLLVPEQDMLAARETGQAAPWMLWLIPVSVLTIAGSLAIAAMVLIPRISVAEALRLALRRLPIAVAAAAVFVGAALVGTLAAGFAGLLGRPVGAAALVLVAGALAYGAIRVMLQLPVIVAEAVGPIAALRRSWAITRGNFARLAAFIGLILIASLVLGAVAAVVGGVVGLLIGKLSGVAALAALITALISAVLSSIFSIVATVMLAMLYRQAVRG